MPTWAGKACHVTGKGGVGTHHGSQALLLNETLREGDLCYLPRLATAASHRPGCPDSAAAVSFVHVPEQSQATASGLDGGPWWLPLEGAGNSDLWLLEGKKATRFRQSWDEDIYKNKT